ncbi:hypothetical protein H7R52_02060 [Weissella confusa]|uniref:Uncharacterized protein n=1 Tax=Weissella confusa TaxID=1583 RepID=A0A923SMN0_WEICO|nr:hypothetical protein [Weissella confusa]
MSEVVSPLTSIFITNTGLTTSLSIARIVVMKVLGNNLLIDLVLVFMVAMAVSLFGEWLSKKLKLVAFIFYPTRFYAK